MKYLNDKPVRDLVADQYLKLHIAEQDKLIKISVCEDLKGLTSSLYLDEVKQLYYRVCFGYARVGHFPTYFFCFCFGKVYASKRTEGLFNLI